MIVSHLFHGDSTLLAKFTYQEGPCQTDPSYTTPYCNTFAPALPNSSGTICFRFIHLNLKMRCFSLRVPSDFSRSCRYLKIKKILYFIAFDCASSPLLPHIPPLKSAGLKTVYRVISAKVSSNIYNIHFFPICNLLLQFINYCHLYELAF